MVSGIINSMDLPVTAEQVKKWEAGGMVHEIFPELTADQREFLLTGIVGDEWNVLYPSS